MSRAIVLSVGPLAASSATKISASQKAAGAQFLVMNGAATAAVANNICLSQSPTGVGALTLNGSLATTNPIAGAGGTAAAGSAIAYLPTPGRIYITSAGNDSGVTFAVVGTLQGPGTFGPGAVFTETITGANTSIVSSSNIYSTIISITISGASASTVTVGTNGIATLDTARRVIMTSGGNDTGMTFALAGTDWAGNAISETVTGASGAAATSVLDYLTVTSIKTSAAVATTVTVGTNGVAGSPWARLDELGAMGPTSLQISGSGTVNWTVSQTIDDPDSTNNAVLPANMTWINHPDTNLVSSTTVSGVQGNYAYPPKFARIILNSQTNPGKVTLTVMQNYQT